MFNVKKNIFVNSIGDVLRCKRASFTMQKVPFYNVKGALLNCKRAPFIKLVVIAWISGGYKLNFYILFLVP